MAENYDDISCEDVIYSEDYQDYIKEYFQDFSSIAGTYHPVCIEAIGSRYAVMHLAGDTSIQNILSDYNISMLPALYGLLGYSRTGRERYFIFSQITLSEFERFRCDDRCH